MSRVPRRRHSIHAFLYDQATGISDLGEVQPTWTENDKLGINNSGQVVGTGYYDNGTETVDHAFLYTQKTGMIDLGTLPGDDWSGASGINDSGQVVGGSFHYYDDTTIMGQAFLYSPKTGMAGLGTLGGLAPILGPLLLTILVRWLVHRGLRMVASTLSSTAARRGCRPWHSRRWYK